MKPLVILDVVGLTPSLLGEHTPHFNRLARVGFQATLGTVLPAVTCSVQSTFLTGLWPQDHGIVGNGWYFRDRAEVAFWQQSNHLVRGEKLWDSLRQRRPGATVAQLFWWYNMYADVDWSVTPRPSYCCDGAKYAGIYTAPSSLRPQIEGDLGPFPLFDFWGPRASIRSSEWIANCARAVFEAQRPDLLLAYLPHLDYDLQRLGPDHPSIPARVAEIDRVAGNLIQPLLERECTVVVLSEYGIEPVSQAVFPNRILREAGLLETCWTPRVGELLDAGASRAFAVCDHQIAHVYTSSRTALRAARELFEGRPGIEIVLDREGKRQAHLDHPRSGELVLVAAPGAWLAYPYWLDDARAPDFAATVDIHRKPGYDPCELFVDPKILFPRAKIGWQLMKKALGFRYKLDVIPFDASLVKGSHGRLPADPDRGPVLLCSDPAARVESLKAVEVKSWLLAL